MIIKNEADKDRIEKDSNGLLKTETQPLIEKSEKTEKVTCMMFIKNLKIELFMILFMFSYIVAQISSQNLFINKACLNVYLLPVNVCRNLDNYTEEKEKVEVYADNYNLYKTLIETIPAVFFSMVFGAWSDKYGRKLPVIFALIGLMIEKVGLIMNIVYFSAPMYFILLTAVPPGIFGGFTVTLMCMYSLVSEQTTKKKRTIKFALVELFVAMGVPLGTFFGGFVFKYYGYIYVFLLSLGLEVLCMLCLIFVVKQTGSFQNVMTCKAFKDLFCFDNFKESYKAFIRHRENNIRLEIWLLVGSMCTVVATYSVKNGFEYFFTKWMYSWDVATYSNVSSIFMIVGIVVVVITLPLLFKVLKVSDVVFGTIGSISIFTSDIVKGIAYESWIYYLGSSFGILSGMAIFAIRSRLSKIVSEEELGKIFSIVSSCESLVPVIGSVLFTQIFNASIHFLPGMPFIIAGAFIVLPIVSFPWISSRNISHSKLTENPDEDLRRTIN